MKYLLILIISFNSYAAWKVEIMNKEDQSMSKEFDTEAELDAYVLDMESKEQWGKDVHEAESCLKGFTTQRDDNGTTLYMCNKEYTTTKSDITAEVAVRDAKDQLKNDIKFGESLYEDITLMIKSKSGMDKATRRATRASFSDITLDLKAGSICDAREDIAAITPTTVITAQDITDVLALIDAYKTCP